ncbi:MAG: tRNA pseudouridine(13) synthase TruD [Deltaproteobacteria bacterium]|nr:tRNA pseudouridine(13) synthase TruD [Deltaproteobacteria bacterium]
MRLLGPPRCTGLIRQTPEDFRVEEIPAYPPAGQGAHLLCEVEKRDLGTEQVVRILSRALDVRAGEIGTAGLKDRRAIARQWISVPARAAARLAAFRAEGIAIVQASRHANKLKTGHLRGNRFDLWVRRCEPGMREEVCARFDRLVERGVPNYFGPQRFGHAGRNEALGRQILAGQGRRARGKELRLLLSAVQAALFNDLLARRISEGLFSRALAGDVMALADRRGHFLCRAPEVDQPRMDRLEIHPTGPMFGPRMMQPEGEPARAETEILAASGLGEEDWRRFKKLTRGTRRALRFGLQDASLSWHDDSARLRFSLPPGAYATAVLRELFDIREDESPSQDAKPWV